MKILFQGDSITDAFRKPEEINPGYQLGNGYAFLAASCLAAKYPDRGWEFVNRGISGSKVADLTTRWQADVLDIAPDLLSLLIGVNDTISGDGSPGREDDERFLDTYVSLLETVRLNLPRARILLLEPFLLETGEVTAAWKEHLRVRQEGIARIAAERKLPLVPLQKILDQACERAPAGYWAYDGIHPTHAGAQLIANAWLEAAEPFFCTAGMERL